MKKFKDLLVGKDYCSLYSYDVSDRARFILLDTMEIYNRIDDIQYVYKQSELWSDEENEERLPSILVTYLDGNNIEDVLGRELDNEFGIGIYKDWRNLKIDYQTVPFLEHLYNTYSDSIFPTPYNVLNHLLATLGNGISCYDFEMKDDTRPFNKKYSIGSMIDTLPPQPIINIYPFSANFFLDRVTRFKETDYRRIKGIEKYADLFVKCVEMSTEETIMDYFMANMDITRKYFRWVKVDNLRDSIKDLAYNSMKEIHIWKEHLDEFKEFYGV